MRKRVSRPRRFAAIDNDAIDTLPSVLGVGLLTTLIRAKDGDDVTVETLAERYEEGEKSLTKAMRSLVEGAYVVKFKIQRASTESVIEDGKEVVKRGGSWYTTFTVDSIPFTLDDVVAMVAEIYAEGNVKSHRVEPTRLDPRGANKASERPAPPKGGVGATCGNATSESSGEPRPTPPSGAPGRPTPGQGGAHIRKKTTSAHTELPEDENEALSARSAVDGRSPSTSGSSAREVEGGVAASSKASPSDNQHDDTRRPAGGQKSSSKAKHTREQLALVAAVRAYFPEHVLSGWTDPETGHVMEPLPELPVISDAILGALAGDVPGADRTAAQLGARVRRRWNHHEYASRFYSGTMDNLVGSVVAMVRPLKSGDRYGCANPRCEDGADVDTGGPCAICPERIADRRAKRRQQKSQTPAGQSNTDATNRPDPTATPVPAQRPTLTIDGHAGLRECANFMCGRPLAKGSTDSLCHKCRQESEDLAAEGSVPAPF